MIVFKDWQIAITGTIARQYDNLSRRIDVTGDLPEGYTWRLLVQCGSNADTLLLQPTETGVGAVLTADNLSKSGEYYFQLRGVLQSDGVTRRHTNIVSSFIPQSLTGLGTWPEVPTEFAQIEQRCAASMIAAESAAEAAKADADRAAALAAEVAEKAAQTAQDATESAQAKEAAQTAQRLADEAQSAAEAARNAAETAQAAAEQSATDAVGAKQGAEAALKAAQDAAAAADQALADLQALYQEMQTWAQGVVQDVNDAGSHAVQSVQSAGDAQVQRVTDEGTRQTANAKAQADAAARSADSAAQSAQQAAESAAVYDEVVTDVTQLKDDIADITPDDTAVDGKPWTSKHIVDSLCQPIEESGNPVQCYPVEHYPLGVKVSMEPIQDGSGDPSPENVRPITGRDSVSVTRCGKNLLDFPSNVKVSTLANASKNYTVELDGIKDVILQWKFTGTAGNTAGCLSIRYNDGSSEIVAYWGNSIGSKKITKAANRLTLSDWTGLNGDMVIEYVQIEPGDTATAYEPYTGSTTDIALPETVYGGTLDLETGVLTVTHGNIAAYAGESIPGKWISDRDVYAQGATPTDGAQVVYELAEPYTIQLTPQQITALSGVNTIYTDADGVIVTGAEDPKHTITELKNAIISLGGNV